MKYGKKSIYVYTLYLIIAFTISLTISACSKGSEDISSTQNNYSDEEVLHSIETAIEKRNEISKGYNAEAEAKLTIDEKEKLWKSFVEPETEVVEQYQNTSFSNGKFNTIIHIYFDGIQQQKRALEYYPDFEEIFKLSWENGYKQRAVAIKELSDTYGLKVSQELYDEYAGVAQNLNIDANSSVEEQSGNLPSQENFTTDPISIESISVTTDEYNIFIEGKLKNTTDQELKNVVVNLNLLDKSGNILTQTFLYNDGIIKSKQSAVTTVSVAKMNIDSIYIRSFQFYDSKGTDYNIEPKDSIQYAVKSIMKNEGKQEGTSSQKEGTSTTEKVGTTEKKEKKKDKAKSSKIKPEEEVEKYIRTHVLRNYDDTRIDSISINDDLGTDEEGDYIALVNLTWDVKNSVTTTEKMLQMYSDDLAASLAKEQPKVQEVAIFWNVPYLGKNTSKWSYERKGEGMYQSDKIFGY